MSYNKNRRKNRKASNGFFVSFIKPRKGTKFSDIKCLCKTTTIRFKSCKCMILISLFYDTQNVLKTV